MALYDPYAAYRGRNIVGFYDPDRQDEKERKIPGPDHTVPPPPPPKEPRKPGDKTEGKVGYEDIEPPIPKPGPEVYERLKAGDETDEDRAAVRAFREYQGRKGKWIEGQLGQGIVPRGVPKSVLNMLNTYGQMAPNVDILNGYIWDTRQGIPSDRYKDKDGNPGVTPAGGGWVKMDSQTWSDMRKFNSRYFDTQEGRAAGKAWDGNNYVAEQQRKWLGGWGERYKHVTWDPAAGIYYSYHGPNARNPYTFLDKYGKETGMPTGWTAPGSGMVPNQYELNEPGSTRQYPYPGAGSSLVAAPPLFGPPPQQPFSDPTRFNPAAASVTRTGGGGIGGVIPGISPFGSFNPSVSPFSNTWSGTQVSPQQGGGAFNIDTSRPMPGLDPYDVGAYRRVRSSLAPRTIKGSRGW